MHFDLYAINMTIIIDTCMYLYMYLNVLKEQVQEYVNLSCSLLPTIYQRGMILKILTFSILKLAIL